MGFLNHSTNNIIIDAVLTERGRELLASSNGLRISKFAFGDDEVDYSNITKYGLVIGKEKIEKNTPIYEASTNENIALKNKLITLPLTNTSNFYLPILKAYTSKGSDVALDKITQAYTIGNPTPMEVYVQTYINTDNITTLDTAIQDTYFLISFNNELLEAKNSDDTIVTAGDVDQNKIKTIRLSTNPLSSGLKELTFKIQRKRSFVSSLFNKYGRAGNLNEIATEISVRGNISNASVRIPVVITNGSSSST